MTKQVANIKVQLQCEYQWSCEYCSQRNNADYQILWWNLENVFYLFIVSPLSIVRFCQKILIGNSKLQQSIH